MIYHFDTYSVDTERLEFASRGEVVSLQPQVFALLVFLIENCARVVTKDEVIDAVWQGRAVSDSTLNARINALRRAVGDDGVRQGVVKTHPRQGFRFVAEIESPPAGKPLVRVAMHGAEHGASIAVLPFANISGDPEQVYFADGLTEDLITDLSKIPNVFVIARNSSFAFRDSDKSLTEIGEELGVAHVLEGSVRRAGSRIRINAQLIDTATGGHVWAERYDGDIRDIFEVQDEITAKIIAALKISLSTTSVISRQTESVEAYELSLRGRAKFFMFSPQTNAESIQLLEAAVAIDPNFSNAWAEQVFPYQSGWSFAWPGYDDGLKIAVEKAQMAARLAPDSSLAHSRLGWTQIFDRNTADSIASFERALEIDPNNADTYVWFSEALNFAGEPQRAIEAGEKALRYDPVAPPNVTHHLGHAYFLLGDFEKAENLCGRALRMAPTFPPAHIIMTVILAEMGRTEDARAQLANLLEIDSDYRLDRFVERYPYHNASHFERMITGLKTAGLR